MLSNTGLVWREVLSGVGFVDLVLVFSRTPHLIELKIMKTHYDGAVQLGAYMETEGRHQGWLVLFDARRVARRSEVPPKTIVSSGVINNVIIDINPIAPSRIRASS